MSNQISSVNAYKQGFATYEIDQNDGRISANPFHGIEGYEEAKRAWDEGYSAATKLTDDDFQEILDRLKDDDSMRYEYGRAVEAVVRERMLNGLTESEVPGALHPKWYAAAAPAAGRLYREINEAWKYLEDHCATPNDGQSLAQAIKSALTSAAGDPVFRAAQELAWDELGSRQREVYLSYAKATGANQSPVVDWKERAEVAEMNLKNFEEENRELRRVDVLKLLEELHALVWGECPSLLNEDSGGNSALDMAIRDVIAKDTGSNSHV